MAFADRGDRVAVRPADRLSLTLTGPFSPALAADPDNLILRALRALGEAAGIGEPPLAVALDKRLPIAAGLGGGSSDAASALRLANRALSLGLTDSRLEALSRVIGADGPMCLRQETAWAEGVGDRLDPEPRLPPLAAVLINPGAAAPTGAVYRAYDASTPRRADRPEPPEDWSVETVLTWLGEQRNDLERAAIGIAPTIETALQTAADQPGARVVRMSGSGATVFALFDAFDAAEAAAKTVARARPDWWVSAAWLGARGDRGTN